MSAPTPRRSGPPPPPPNRVQQLVAMTGAAVYERGSSLLDQPVLVYVARPPNMWPDFEVFDHVGRHFGSVRKTNERHFLSSANVGRFSIFDYRGNPLLNLQQVPSGVNYRFTVHGIVQAEIKYDAWREQLTISAGGRAIGSVSGPGRLGVAGDDVSLEDHRSQAVARLVAHKEHKVGLISIPSYVMSVDPQLGGPLRHIMPAVPAVVAIARRLRRSRT